MSRKTSKDIITTSFNVKWRFDEKKAVEYFLQEGAYTIFEASKGKWQSELYLAYMDYLVNPGADIIDVSDYYERLFFHLGESELKVLNVAKLLLEETTLQEGLGMMTNDVVIFLGHLLPKCSGKTINKDAIISSIADYLNKLDFKKNNRSGYLRDAFARICLNENGMLRRKYETSRGITPASVYKVNLHFLWEGKIDTTEVIIPSKELDKEGEIDSKIKEYIADIIYARGVTKGIEAVAISYEIPSYRVGVSKRDLANEIKDFIANEFFNVSGQDALTEFAYYVNFGRDVAFYSDVKQLSSSQSVSIFPSSSFDPNVGIVVGIAATMGLNNVMALAFGTSTGGGYYSSP